MAQPTNLRLSLELELDSPLTACEEGRMKTFHFFSCPIVKIPVVTLFSSANLTSSRMDGFVGSMCLEKATESIDGFRDSKTRADLDSMEMRRKLTI